VVVRVASPAKEHGVDAGHRPKDELRFVGAKVEALRNEPLAAVGTEIIETSS
jgi:hypothetical protein